MNTSISLQEKITSIAEVVIRERLNVLAAVLASTGASTAQQHILLDRLVLAIQDAQLQPQVTDSNGNPIIVDTQIQDDKQTILFNEKMLLSVAEITEEMIIDTLARPISKILGLPAATVAIILHERDEERIRELSVKLAATVEGEVINFTSLKTVQSYLLRRFFVRITKVCEILSGGAEVPILPEDTPGMAELLDKIAEYPRWPSWETIRGDETTSQGQSHLKPLNQVIQNSCLALSHTPWCRQTLKIIQIIWNCSDLVQRRFLVEAGRNLRSAEVDSPANVLMAIAEAVSSDAPNFSLRLEDWPRFCELQSAMDRLYLEESASFGTASEDRNHKRPVTVVDVAARAFGMCEPDELPWSMPLLCWTQRETDALRDLFLGKCKTTYGTAARMNCRKTYDFTWHDTGASELITDNLDKLPSVQVMPIGSEAVDGIADAFTIVEAVQPQEIADAEEEIPGNKTVVERCWKAAFKALKDHFFTLHSNEREEALSMMRHFYADVSPHMKDTWDRRFTPIMRGNKKRAFSTLVRELAAVTGKPCLIDPFESVESSQFLEKPRLVIVSAMANNQNVSVVWIPIAFLASTKIIGPLQIRLIEEREFPAEEGEPSRYAWLRDIPIHIDFFKNHPQDVLLQCVYGDSLQIVLEK